MTTVPKTLSSGKPTPATEPEPKPQAAGRVPNIPQPPAQICAGEEPEFREITCRNGKITERAITTEEALNADVDEPDFYWDEVFGRISIRTRNGNRIEYFGSIPGVGKVGTAYLLEMMRRPGQLLTWRHVWSNSSLRSFVNPNAQAARLCVLRRAFGESAAAPWFFLARSRPYRTCWNVERSWRMVTHLVQPQVGLQPVAQSGLTGRQAAPL